VDLCTSSLSRCARGNPHFFFTLAGMVAPPVPRALSTIACVRLRHAHRIVFVDLFRGLYAGRVAVGKATGSKGPVHLVACCSRETACCQGCQDVGQQVMPPPLLHPSLPPRFPPSSPLTILATGCAPPRALIQSWRLARRTGRSLTRICM